LIVAGRADRSSGSPLLWACVLVAAGFAGLALALLSVDQLLILLLVASLVGVAALLCIGHPRWIVVLGAFTYIGALHWVYLDWVSPVYAYYGLISTGADWLVLLIITAIAALPAVWLPVEFRRPSDVVLWFLYLFGYVPACVIPIHVLGPDLMAALPFSVAVAIGFSVLALTRRIRPASTPWRGLSAVTYERVLSILGLGAAAYLIVLFGVPTGLPDFESVYGTRAGYDAVATVTPGTGYFVPWVGNVVYPFLIALGLVHRRWHLVALGIAGDLLVYSIAGYKSVLFAIALTPAIYAVVTWARPRMGPVLTWATVGMIGATVVATWLSGSLWPLALFVTRLLAVPGQMAAYYYDFFSSHDTYLLSASFLRWFISPPYDLDPPHLIGAVYLHSPTTDANANLWADAMANFGLLGIVPFSVVLGGVLWVIDSVSSGRDLRVIAPTLGLMGIILGNGAVFTTILTLGVGLAIILIALMPRRADPSDATAPLPLGP
jgi:hypothetical protein